MPALQSFPTFLLDNQEKLFEQLLEHIGLTFLSLLLAIALAVPVGIWVARQQKFAGAALGVAGILQTIPSIALLGALIPILGIGIKPAIFALFLYALLPILRNTYTGITEVDAAVKEAAVGMGMTPRQVLMKVELPLALPVIFAGIRTATVINVGVATLAAYIGAGGLGEFIFGGIALNNSNMILAGAIPAALLAIVFDQGLAFLQNLRVQRLLRTSGFLLLILPLFAFSYYVPNLFTSGISAGFDPEFRDRGDGYPRLVDLYGLDFNTLILNAGLMYKAVDNKSVDVISGYSTDGRIKAFDLKVLADDKNAFPPYFCTPVVNGQTARAHPELVEAVNLLGGTINDSIMTELNYRVDFEKQAPEQVAAAFLEELGLAKADQAQGGEVVIIGSKIFSEQYILAHLFGQLIDGYTDLDVDIKTGLGGTKICFDALQAGEIDLYAEYTGTAFLVILEPPGELVEEINDDANAVYEYVANEFRKQFELEWLEPLGFNNTYALITRKEQANREGWEKISDLAR